MATMHPYCESDTDLERLIPQTRDGWQGERRLYKFLRDCTPHEWHVFYNLNIECNNTHQLDFILLVPGKGIVNVDAKGYEYCLKDGCVYLRNTPIDIYGKAQGAIHTLNDYIRQAVTNQEPWGAYNCLVVFTLTEKVVPAGMENHAFSLQGLETARKEVSDAFASKINELLDKHYSQHENMKCYVGKIIDHFSHSEMPFVVNLRFKEWDKFSELMLTVPQKEILSKIVGEKYGHVTGGAGTGKSILAMMLARKFAREQKKVLYVCYNRALGDMMRKRNDGIPNLKVTSFYRIGCVFGRNINFSTNGNFDRCEADSKIEKALGDIAGKDKFNILIVDEAQDLSDRNLRFLLSLLKTTDRRVILFSDAGQSIFSYEDVNEGWDYNEESLFQGEVVAHHQLSVNYRNANPIHERLSEYEIEKTVAYWDAETLGIQPVPVKSIGLQEVRSVLCELLENNAPSSIALLSATNQAYEAITNFNDAKGRSVRFTDDVNVWLHGNRILKTTIHAFKGLEADIVLLFGTTPESCPDKLRYVGESRAKYQLYVVQ